MTHKQLRRRKYIREWNRRRRAKLRALGLSTTPNRYGQPLLRKKHNFKFKLQGLKGEERNREYDRLWQQQRDSLLKEQGLSTCSKRRGLPLVRVSHKFGSSLSYNEKARLRYKFYAARNRAMGLTGHGKPRKVTPLSDIEARWREFRSTMEIPVTKSWADWIPLHGEEKAA